LQSAAAAQVPVPAICGWKEIVDTDRRAYANRGSTINAASIYAGGQGRAAG
jgi:hypothetical protein